MSNNFDLKLFITSIFVTLLIAGIGYSLQNWIIPDILNKTPFISWSVRLFRMLLGYFLIPFLYLNKTDQSIKKIGFEFISNVYFIIAIVVGIMIYLVPSYVFVKNQIFSSQWQDRSLIIIIVLQSMIGIMAALTDLWTRGFVLLQLNMKFGELIAIIGQNILWFGIHIYEIFLLESYIGLLPAIILTLFLGISGDLLVLKTKNITGLMLGHIMLNIFIVLAGKGILV